MVDVNRRRSDLMINPINLRSEISIEIPIVFSLYTEEINNFALTKNNRFRQLFSLHDRQKRVAINLCTLWKVMNCT